MTCGACGGAKPPVAFTVETKLDFFSTQSVKTFTGTSNSDRIFINQAEYKENSLALLEVDELKNGRVRLVFTKANKPFKRKFKKLRKIARI